MFTKLISGEIRFFYTHAAIFDDVQHLSAFMCKNIADKEGVDHSEQFALTDDEEGMFKVCLREALSTVYDSVKVLTHGLEDAFQDSGVMSSLESTTITPGTTIAAEVYREQVSTDQATPVLAIGTDGKAVYVVGCAGETAESGTDYYTLSDTAVVIIRTVDHGAYNLNDPRLVDSAILSAIEQGVLSEFYTRVTEKTLTEMSQQQFVAALASVAGRIIPLRKKTVL